MYKSPIEILMGQIETSIAQQKDEMIYKAIINCGVNVDKEELILALKNDRNQYQRGYLEGMVDAQQHGRWVDRYGVTYANHHYECSECQQSALFRDEMDVLGNWRTVQVLSYYCPHCGAKMDGGTDNG